MSESKHTRQELAELQALPLSLKVRLTQQRIREWVNHYGVDGVYVSFSGGKDSTVLLHLVRDMFPDVVGVFCDTGLEYPEIRAFVRTFDNIEWIKPKKNFRQVITEYGYPFITKDVSKRISAAQRYWEAIGRPKNIDDYFGMYSDAPANAKMLFGTLEHKKNGIPTGEPSKLYDFSRYKFTATSPFKFSDKCCYVFKKRPLNHFSEVNGKVPITGQMAEEGRRREENWLKHGCNMFDATQPISNPMSFWTEQDVLHYIKFHDIKIASVYGVVVVDDKEQLEGQMSIADYGLLEDIGVLKTTGCQRTGCIFCGYGCHREPAGEGRFERLKVTHPKIYDYIMRPWEEGGLNYKEVIDWLNENGNLNIRY